MSVSSQVHNTQHSHHCFQSYECLLETINKSSSLLQAELMDGMSCFGRSAAELMSQAGELQYKLKHSMMLLTASKAYVRHPELAKAMYEEHKYRPSLKEPLESIISGATLMADSRYRHRDHHRTSRDAAVGMIVIISVSSCTRDERRERIVAECSVSAVRQALQVARHPHHHHQYRSHGNLVYCPLLHKLREMSHLSSLMKIALATIAVSLH